MSEHFSPEYLEWLKGEFERVWPWLDASLETQPIRTHDKEHVWKEVENATSQLWTTVNSATLVNVVTYPTGVKACFAWLAGGKLDEILYTARSIEAYAREIGCDAFAAIGRRGWLKALDGFKDGGTTVVKELL